MITGNPIFDLNVANLPIVNVRGEFDCYLEKLSDAAFVEGLRYVRNPVELPTITWKDLPKNLLTFMLQRSILGVEACAAAAVEYRLAALGRFDAAMARKLNDPVKLPGPRGGMADVFYNKMPAVIDPALQLRLCSPQLWETVKRFYKEVRNPLFHGYQLHMANPANVRDALLMFKEVYAWMDTWWGAFANVP